MMEKNIAIKDGEKVHDVVIRPGTSVADIIGQLRLPPEYELVTADKNLLKSHEVVWDGIEDGAKLTAAPPARVG